MFRILTEIRNPGKLFGNLTIEDLRKGNISQRRNPLIADLFRRIEMVEETPEKPQRNPKELILAALKKQPSLSIRELAVQCRMSVHSAQHHVNKLKEAGAIRHVGPTKAGRWEVIEDHIDKSGDRMEIGND